MKLSISKIIYLFTFLALNSISLWGYNLRFSNLTERLIVISYKFAGLSQEHYQIIPPDQSVSQFFLHAHCLAGSLFWAEFKTKDALGKALPFEGGLALIDEETGVIPMGEMQQLFKKHLAHKYAFIPLPIKVVDNDTFQMTIDAASQLARGIDSLACQSIKTAIQFINPLASASQSSEMQTSTTQTTNSEIVNKLTESHSLSDAFAITSALINTMGSKDEPESSEMYGTNKPTENAFIQSQPTAPEKKSRKSCRFGLGKIAAAGGALAGVTLCRDLHLAIVDTGEVGSLMSSTPGRTVSRIKKPLLIAEINQGE